MTEPQPPPASMFTSGVEGTVQDTPGEQDLEDQTSSRTDVQVQPQDLPVEGSANLVLEVPENDFSWRKVSTWKVPTRLQSKTPVGIRDSRKLQLVILFGIIAFVLMIGLAVGLTRNKGDQSQSTSNNQEPEPIVTPPPVASPSYFPTLPPVEPSDPQGTPSPTFSPQRLVEVQNWLLNQNYASQASLDDIDSPQANAMKFMWEDAMEIPTDVTSNANYIWLDRYVMSVLYYATGGSKWSNSMNFMNHDTSTCEWHEKTTLNGQEYTIGAVCETGCIVAIRMIQSGLKGSIPEELGLLTKLEYLNMQANRHISGTIPSSLQNLKSLEVFSMIDCSLSSTIPEWIGSWTSMLNIGLTGNMLTGSLSEGLGQMSSLNFLALDDNIFTGSLKSLGGLPQLRFLYVEKNEFSESINSTFLSSLVALEQLDISDNRFDGEVPVHLMSHPNMKVIDCHGNQLTAFPDNVPADTVMEFLTFHQNPISSTFPRTIGNLQKLTHLDLTTTFMVGEMPPVIGNLTNLSYLFMADTSFNSGPIPSEYAALTSLVDMSLKASGRSGPIPSWLQFLKQLTLLDLDANGLTGAIPNELANITGLNFLMLNSNQLQGTIPTELGSVRSLQLVFMDNNNLAGTFPLCDLPARAIYTADCAGSNPELVCDCCTCCNDVEASPSCQEHKDLDYLAQYDPEWWDSYDRKYYDYTFINDFNITRKT